MSKSVLKRLKAQGVTSITVECVGCKSHREIKAHEIAPDDVPLCGLCYLPMVPTAARRRKGGGG